MACMSEFLLLNLIVVKPISVHCMVYVHLGETIDGRVCETLEEIFRRVRFRCIDLEATSLDEEVGCFAVVLPVP